MRSSVLVSLIAILTMSLRFTSVKCSTILAKSNMLVCQNEGSSVGDTKEILKSQDCKKKVIVTLAVESNQGESEQIHAMVDSVVEENTHDEVKLKKPFRIQVTKSETIIKYPMTYIGVRPILEKRPTNLTEDRVNHKPFEIIVKKRHPSPCCGVAIYDRCTEGWFDSGNACPWWYHVHESEQHRQPPYTKERWDPKRKSNRPRVWASQGFCCVCSWKEKHNNIKPYKRGGRSCTWYIHTWVKHQAYGHCLAFDNLWDRVYEVLPPYPVFTVNVSVTEVDRYMTTFANFQRATWRNVGYFLLSPSRLKGQTAEGRVHGEYVGDLQVSRQLQKLGNKYLVWPEWYLLEKGEALKHEWIQAGHKEWLLLEKYLFDFRGDTCNKMGVSFSAFKFGQELMCRRKRGSCLEGQPANFVEEGRNERNRSRKSPYFLDFYGRFIGADLHGKYLEPSGLKFKAEENYNSIIVLTLDAKDIALVYNRSPGKLVEVYADDFEALSKSGQISAVVLNTGLVASDYTVTVSGCSSGIGQVPSKKGTIDPGLTEQFDFEIEQYYIKGGIGLCTVSLYDVKFVKMDSMTVNFTTFAPCFCPRTCNCSAGCTPDTIDCANITDIAPATKSSMGWGWLGGFLSKVWGVIKGVFGIFSSLWSGLLAILGLLLLLGMIKVALDACSKVSSGLGGIGGPIPQNQTEKEVKKEVISGKTKTSGWLLALQRNRNVALLKGMFYFLYCPFIPCVLVIKHVISRVTSKKELRRLRKERRMRLLAKELEGEDTNDEQGSDVEKIEKEITQKTEILEELDYGLSDEYSRSEIETSDEPYDIDELMDYRYPVFLNFYKVDSEDHPGLKDSGGTYSLCGQVFATKGTEDYQTFDIHKYDKQMIQIVDGQTDNLPEPIALPKYCQTMDTNTTLSFITYKPLFPCLNRRRHRVKKQKVV